MSARTFVDTEFVKHEDRVMKNVTISMDEDTATWTRVQAARANKSVSKYIAELLERERMRDSQYDESMKSFLARKPFLTSDRPIPTREELYDRPGLR